MTPPVVLNLGGWTYGDISAAHIFTIRDEAGALTDLTGASSIALIVNSLNGAESFQLAGTICAAAGQISVTGFATEGTQPRSGKSTSYTGRLRWLASGDAEFSFLRADIRFSVEHFSLTGGADPTAVLPSFDLHELLRLNPFTFHSGDANLELWLNTSTATPVAVDIGGTGVAGIHLRGSHVQVDTGVGANKVIWYKEEPARTVYTQDALLIEGSGQEQTFRISHTISCYVSVTTISNATATQYVGIGLGGPNNSGTYPFPSTGEGGENPCIQLRAPLTTKVWEACVWRGEGEDGVVTPLVGVDDLVSAGADRRGCLLKIVWDSEEIEARFYVNGVLGLTITDPALLPPPIPTVPVQAHIGPNYFFSSGSHASGRTLGQVMPMLVTRPNALTPPADV